MDLHGKKKIWRTFGYAVAGIKDVIQHEKNMRIHLVISVITIIGALVFRFTLIEWLILLLVIAGVFSFEMMNSAVERAVDLVTLEEHPLAKRAKDAAAAAVFVYCIFAVIIGLLLFIPAMIERFM